MGSPPPLFKDMDAVLSQEAVAMNAKMGERKEAVMESNDTCTIKLWPGDRLDRHRPACLQLTSDLDAPTVQALSCLWCLIDHKSHLLET